MLQRCALPEFHVTDGQNTCGKITSDRRSKLGDQTAFCAVLCIPYIVGGSPNECWLHTCDACVITAWRLGLWASLVARKYIKNGREGETKEQLISCVMKN